MVDVIRAISVLLAAAGLILPPAGEESSARGVARVQSEDVITMEHPAGREDDDFEPMTDQDVEDLCMAELDAQGGASAPSDLLSDIGSDMAREWIPIGVSKGLIVHDDGIVRLTPEGHAWIARERERTSVTELP